jgi:hypothetical protein
MVVKYMSNQMKITLILITIRKKFKSLIKSMEKSEGVEVLS